MESDSATHKTNMSKLSTRQLKKDKMPFVLMGAGLLALIIFFAVLFPREERPRVKEQEQAEPAPGRLEQLETRLSKLEWMSGKIEQLEDREKAFESYRDRLEKLEETLSSRMEHLEKRMENFQKRGDSSRPAPRQPVKVPETRKPSVKTGARYHIVGAGETLYQIGRKYGVAVDALRRFNQLLPGTAIHPGQKIFLTPSGNE